MAGISNATFPRSVGNRPGNRQRNLNAVHIVNGCSNNNYKDIETGAILRNLTPSLDGIPQGSSHNSSVFHPSYFSSNFTMDNPWDNQFQSEETSENIQFRKEPSKTVNSNFQPSVGEHSIKPAGLTWARWAEKGSPKAPFQNSRCNTSEAPVELKNNSTVNRAIVSKTETSEETLLRRVRSTARLWHDTANSPSKHYLKRTSSLRVPSSREASLEKSNSQGLGDRYKKKPGRFSPYGYPML